MERARRAATSSSSSTRRKPLPGSPSPRTQSLSPSQPQNQGQMQSPSASQVPMGHLDAESPSTPSLALHATTSTNTSASTPSTATIQGRRASRSAQNSFSFSAPGPSRPQQSKKRSSTADGFAAAEDDTANDGSPQKGGHSLRKRARVDYTQEHIDDQASVPNATMAASAARSKKRKSDTTDSIEDHHQSSSPPKKRANLSGLDVISSNQRDSARRSVDTKVDARPDIKARGNHDDDDIQDVIEVGVSFSEADQQSLRRPSSSTASTSASSAERSLTLSASAAALGAKSAAANAPQDDANAEASQVLKPESASISPTAILSARSAEPESAPDVSHHSISPTEDSLPSAHSHDKQPSSASESSASRDSAAQQILDEQNLKHLSQPNATDASMGHLTTRSPLIGTSTTQDRVEATSAATPSVVTDDLQDLLPGKLPVEEADDDASTVAGGFSQESLESVARGQEGQDSNAAEAAQSQSQSQELLSPRTKLANTTDSTARFLADLFHQGPKSSAPTLTLSIPQGPPCPKLAAKAAAQPIQPGYYRPWEHLSPYLPDEYDLYPNKKTEEVEEDDNTAQSTENRDSRGGRGRAAQRAKIKAAQKENDSAVEAPVDEPATDAAPVIATGESPPPESAQPTAANSPTAVAAVPASEEGGEAGGEGAKEPEAQAPAEKSAMYRFRKMRRPEDYVPALEHHQHLSTEELRQVIEVVAAAMKEWQGEWLKSDRYVADFENAAKRREADAKYEAKTRDLKALKVNHVEPDLVLKGYKAKPKDQLAAAELRWLQSQDRITADSYGLVYDAAPAKLGRQQTNPPLRREEGPERRPRSLRDQPRQTVKASEGDDTFSAHVTGKRLRKPTQPFGPTTQQTSRSGTPVSTATGKRKSAKVPPPSNGEPSSSSSRKSALGRSVQPSPEPEQDGAEEKVQGQGRGRGRRGAKASQAKEATSSSTAGAAAAAAAAVSTPMTSPTSAETGRTRVRKPSRLAELAMANDEDDEPKPEPEAGKKRKPSKQHRKGHLLTLKMPKSRNPSESASVIEDNGASRSSTPSSESAESTDQTVENAYAFRPQRQKRFRDEPKEDDDEEAGKQRPKKKAKRDNSPRVKTAGDAPRDSLAAAGKAAASAPSNSKATKKATKIKVVSKHAASRNGTPASAGEADDQPKDYKSMTKSEKMSASMKNRWADGRMAGAVEKRKATLAAKKAALEAAQGAAQAAATAAKSGQTSASEPAEGGNVNEEPELSEAWPPELARASMPGAATSVYH